MTSIEGFVLAGGLSRRMGRNKAVIPLAGLPLAERAANLLAVIADPVRIVGDLSGDLSGFSVIPDESIGSGRKGALVGLYTALFNAGSEWSAILACDMPLVRAELLTKMTSLCREFAVGSATSIDAILPRQPDGRIQPLCGLYRTRSVLPEVKSLASTDDWRLQELAKRINTHVIEFSAYSDIDGADDCFLNLNTPEELKTAVSLMSR